jgi:hypothetical protein
MKELILIVLASITDTNVVNIKNEVLTLIEVKPSRWTILYNWFKKKIMTVLSWSFVKFPEMRSIKKIYDSLEAIKKYKSKEIDKLISEFLNAILINFQEIENKLKIKEACSEIEKNWDKILEAYKKSSYDKLKEIGLEFNSPKELIESIETLVKLSDDAEKDKNIKKIILLLGALKSNFQ